MPTRLLFAPLLLGTSLALAQDPALEGRRNQKIERVQLEDAGNRIDEVRYGGQTQSITVQPKAGVPAYEVEPGNLARTRPGDSREGIGAGGGQRFWNVFRF